MSPRYSICIPTDCIWSCENLQQITHTVYQIAKTLTLFNIQECVVLEVKRPEKSNKSHPEKHVELSDSMLISSLLQYFITPPYLRKIVFKAKFHKYFQYANKLPKLSVLPYMRSIDDESNKVKDFREGVSIPMRRPINGKKVNKQTKYICIGKEKPIELKSQLVPNNVRVTVNIKENKIVSPHDAYGEGNVGVNASYGYGVRIAHSFNEIYTQMMVPYEQSCWIECGDFYAKLDKQNDNKLTILNELRDGNILIILGQWDRLQDSLVKDDDIINISQFMDGQWCLPSVVPRGHLTVEDACMVAMTSISS